MDFLLRFWFSIEQNKCDKFSLTLTYFHDLIYFTNYFHDIIVTNLRHCSRDGEEGDEEDWEHVGDRDDEEAGD